MRGSWLFPDGVDRERMLDMDRRIRPVRRASFGVLALALILSGPWLGWWTLGPLAAAAVVFRLAERVIDRVEYPEWALFSAWAASEVIIAISVALTGGPRVATMSWFAIPLITLGARFSERGIALGVAITIVLACAVAFGVDAHAVIHSPPVLITPVALMIAISMLQTVLMRSDVDTRAEAVIDALTGMLNRKALDSRIRELEQQSELIGGAVALILGDIDNFKEINDLLGHATGDAVLRDVAYELRKALRTFDLVYRIGGEEFLVLLPGADVEQALAVADELRRQVASVSVVGRGVTMSFGVSASTPGTAFRYDEMFARADEALYEAKREGRDLVRRATAAAVVTA